MAEKGIPVELETEVPWNAETATPRHNPLEKIPVLIVEDGSAVYESAYIVEWLEVMHPEPPLLPVDPRDRLQVRRDEVLAETGSVLAYLDMRWPDHPWRDNHPNLSV